MAPIAKIVCVACTVIGALLLAMGFVVEDMVKSHLTSKASTFSSLADETSPLFPVWRGDDDYIERYMTYYFYNVSNSVAVRQWGAIPAVTVVGPFTYREHAQKFNITWNEDRTKISYLLNRTFTFVDTPCPSGSSFSWTDSDAPLCSLPNTTFVTTANIPLLAIVQQFQNYGWIELDVMNRFIKNINGVVHNESLFPALPVGGMLFGYNDTIMDKLNSIIHDIDDYFNLTYTPRPEFYSLQQRSLFEAIVPSVVSSGAGAASDVGNFDVWAGISQLNMWNGTCNESVFNFEANTVSGTDGVLFPRKMGASDRPSIFLSDLARAVTLSYLGPKDCHVADLMRFHIAPDVFLNSTEFEANCAFDGDGFSGVMNLTRPTHGTLCSWRGLTITAPVYISNPVFLDADSALMMNVTGLDDLEGAETIVDIDPWTGLAFRSHLRFQVNARVNANFHIEAVRRVHRGGFYLPVVVSDTRTAVTQKVIDLWDNEFGQPLRSAGTARLVGLAVGAFMLAISLSLIIVLVSRRYGVASSEKVPLLSNVQIAS